MLSDKENYSQRGFVLLPLLLGLVACRPVWTVGWTEVLILGVILLIFVGPPLLRFYQRYKKFQGYEKEKKKE